MMAGASRVSPRAELNAAASAPELDAAIERMRGRTATEVGAPRLALMSDPEATASCAEAGAAFPLGSRHHVALLGTHYVRARKDQPGATTTSDALALTFVLRHGARANWAVGPRLHVVSPREGGQGISASEARSPDERPSVRRSKPNGRPTLKRLGTSPQSLC
jgi:hypothetical protein